MKKIYFVFGLILIILLGLKPTIHAEMAKGSVVSGVPIEKMTYVEALGAIETNIEAWKQGEMIAENEFESFKIPRDIFDFDVHLSIRNLEDKSKRTLSSFFMKPKNVSVDLITVINDEKDVFKDWPEYVDVKATLEGALNVASKLSDDQVELVFNDKHVIEQEVISDIKLKIPDISDTVLKEIVKSINEQTIEPNSLYSFIDSIVLPKKLTDSSEETSLVATGLYILSLETSFEIIERHSHLEVPKYIVAGLDAEVGVPINNSKSGFKEDEEDEADEEDESKEESKTDPGLTINDPKRKNLILRSVYDYPVTIKAEIKEGHLFMSLEREEEEDESVFKYIIDNKSEIKQRTVERYSSKVLSKKRHEIEKGEPGYQVEVHREEYDLKDKKIDSVLISRDFYPPIPRVVLISTKEEEEDEKAEEKEKEKEKNVKEAKKKEEDKKKKEDDKKKEDKDKK